MMFNLSYHVCIVIIFFILNGASLEIIFLLWFIRGILILIKLYSHISYILLTLELLSIISICLIIILLIKSSMELRFFFLLLCLIVGEACLGIRLIVIRSRFQKKELLSLSLI